MGDQPTTQGNQPVGDQSPRTAPNAGQPNPGKPQAPRTANAPQNDQQGGPQGDGQPVKEPTLKEVQSQQTQQKAANFSQQIKDAAKQVAQTALGRLGNAIDIAPDEIELVNNAAEEITAATFLSPGASPEVLQSLVWRRQASIQALENLAASKAYAVNNALTSAAQEILPALIRAGVQAILGAAVAAL